MEGNIDVIFWLPHMQAYSNIYTHLNAYISHTDTHRERGVNKMVMVVFK